MPKGRDEDMNRKACSLKGGAGVKKKWKCCEEQKPLNIGFWGEKRSVDFKALGG